MPWSSSKTAQFCGRIGVAVACFLFLLNCSRAVAQTTPSTVGQWSGVLTWPSVNAAWVPTHVMLLPNGNVLYWSSYGDGVQPRIFDPLTLNVTDAAQPAYNIFCAGHVHLADGRIFVTGGHIDDYDGYPHASIYDPNANTWTQVADMNAGRWYPTNTTLANGDVLTVSGTINGPASNQVYNNTPQVFQMATQTWRTLTNAVLHQQLYPFMFLAPNGKVFLAGWNNDTRYLDTSGTGAWSFVANSSQWRNYGSAVMYDVGKIMIVGGNGDQVGGPPPTNTAEVINLNSSTPTWTMVAPMHYPRRQLNSTILPDGTVLVTGGASAGSSTSASLAFDNWQAPVYAAEIWNPTTNTWSVMASAAKYRGYHSWALLLPDGRVVTGGGQMNQNGQANGSNAEIFSPPYLFKGTRPTILSAPSSVSYGQTAFVGTNDSIAKVSWIRLGAVTHGFNQDQRFIPLNFTTASGGINVTFPSSGNISPPGHYMLFLLNASGVPSVASIINISGATQTPATISGTVTSSTGAAISGATVSYSGGSTTTSSTGQYTLANVAPGTYTVTASASGYASQSQSISVTSGQSATLNFQLAASTGSATIPGKVTNIATGAALSGVTVSYSGGSTTTSTTGTYTLANVAPGTYNVTAAHSGYLSRTLSVTVSAGQTTTLNIALATAGKVAGMVKTSSGAAISGATVTIKGGKVATTVTLTTSSTGAYSTGWIPIGSYTVTVSKSGYTTQSKSATVNSGTTTTVNFTL